MNYDINALENAITLLRAAHTRGWGRGPNDNNGVIDSAHLFAFNTKGKVIYHPDDGTVEFTKYKAAVESLIEELDKALKTLRTH